MSDDKNNADNQLREFLEMKTRRRKWNAVVEKYEEYPESAQKLKLRRQGDTALHLAVIDNQEEIVEKLVKIICRNPGNEQLLETTNERHNNPLHLAAAQGSARMCHVIASANGRLVDMRNVDDETPLFLAAAYGHMDAFYCLYYFCGNDSTRIATNCREGNNGDTVLHYAIGNEYFDLAFQLIHLTVDSRRWMNKKHLTPLHILASKPASFKSGSHIKGWRKLIYQCILVKNLKPQPIETLHRHEEWKKLSRSERNTDTFFPPNYETCIYFFTRLRDACIYFFTSLCGGFLKVSTLVNKKKSSDEANKDKDLEEHVNLGSENFDPSTITNFPKNYSTCVDFFQIILSAIIILLAYGLGSRTIRKIYERKQKHTWSVQVMEELLNGGYSLDYEDSKMGGSEMEDASHTFEEDQIKISTSTHTIVVHKKDSEDFKDVRESPMLLAARNGVIEMVKKIYERLPMAIYETRKPDKKNVVHLAAEYRQSNVYKFLQRKDYSLDSLFRAVDLNGNSALHLAAAGSAPKLWQITGAALQIQLEVEWYKLVKESVPLHFFPLYNKQGKTASRIFEDTHVDLEQKGKDWLYSTSQSCSVVATLIATVAFATAATIPGGNGDHGVAALQEHKPFSIFVISSLVALCLSTTSVIMFLSILTARFEIREYFTSMLPWKLLLALSSLYFSIIAMLVSFCSGHYFLLTRRLQNQALVLYTLTFLPVAFMFGIVQLPLYFDLLRVLFKIMPTTVEVDLCD